MPWSRAMFAGELIKSSSICLGAFRLERVIGYLIVSLYADDWHIMNLAVDPAWRRRGVAALLLETFSRAARAAANAATRSRCERRTRRRFGSTSSSASWRAAFGAVTT